MNAKKVLSDTNNFCSKVQVLSLLYSTLITFMFLPIDVFFSIDMIFLEKIFNVM